MKRIFQISNFKFQSRPSEQRGAAIIIVLAFVVLLTGIVVAMLTLSLSNLKVSENNAQQIKVDLFARGATETIWGDLRQEIVDGSDKLKNASGTEVADETGQPVYVPKSAAEAMPKRVGTSDALANLTKKSQRNTPFYTIGSGSGSVSGPDRAAAVSTEDVSLNGKYLKADRWNKAYLLPKKTPGSDTDSTPVADFTSPDWILVARDGSNPKTLNTTLMAKGSNPILGRYAYTIYDEGGLVDANVAGYPSVSSAVQKASRAGLSYADLSQIFSAAGFTDIEAQKIVDRLLQWRNYATAQPDQDFPVASFNFSPNFADTYYSYVLSNLRGFLNVGNSSLFKGQSDRYFASRQELQKFLLQGMVTTSTDRAKMQAALCYLATFTRELNQPSYIPNPNRPKIVAGSGGNDALSGDDLINPSFLSIRVTSTFVRRDGSTSIVGEPLVKQRFPLNRLAWLTSEGPSAGAAGSIQTALLNSGVSQTLIDKGTVANIASYFGLSWNTSKHSWTYIHGSAGSTGSIRTLAQVAAAGREPDFFEMLKAGMNVGSIGKSYMDGSYAATTPQGFQQQCDNSVDAQIVQMAANIIDQSDYDSYPTIISFDDDSLLGGNPLEYRGIEDLPYLYRIREGKIMVRDSNPQQRTLPAVGVALTNPGLGVILQEPEIWNPHAWNSSLADNRPRPTAFRIVAITSDPVTNNPQANLSVSVQWRLQSSSSAFLLATSPGILTEANSALEFDIPTNSLHLFREPTLLFKPGVPTNSGLRAPTGTNVSSSYTTFGLAGSANITSQLPATQHVSHGVYATDKSFLGIAISTVPMAWTGTIPKDEFGIGNPAAAAAGVIPAGFAYQVTSPPGITYRLQYRDSSNQWRTYDEKYANVIDAGSYNTPNFSSAPSAGSPSFTNKTFDGNGSSGNIMGSELSQISFDPRSSRFGMIFSGTNGRGLRPMQFPVVPSTNNYLNGWAAATTADQANAALQNAVMTVRPDINQGFIATTYDGFGLSFGINSGPKAAGWYPAAPNSSPGGGTPFGTSAVLRLGLFAQNNPAISAFTASERFTGDTDGASPAGFSNQFFADPDGVVRRGVSAYVRPTSTTPALAETFSGLSMATAYKFSATGVATGLNANATFPNGREATSRPIILNRPFRSVAELGYVFSGTPWRNLDFFTPESGSAALLDVFCVSDTDSTKALVAGKVNLNTRQMPVLNALLVGASRDEFNSATSVLNIQNSGTTSGPLASKISQYLVNRTSDVTAANIALGSGPMANVSELVGKWKSSVAVAAVIDGGKSYTGFSGTDTPVNAPSATPPNLSDIAYNDSSAVGSAFRNVQRYRESVPRALASSGQTRVWNLMIDLVAQSGSYSHGISSLNDFYVEGEQRYWIHIAVDRFTGRIIDQQFELVKE